MKILKMIRQLTEISEDLAKMNIILDDFDIIDFDQTWASTALGFGGMGGSAMTTERTYVLTSRKYEDYAIVYFGGTYAYCVKKNEAFERDLEQHLMASVQGATTRYDMARIK